MKDSNSEYQSCKDSPEEPFQLQTLRTFKTATKKAESVEKEGRN
jgi:hypothetical protein